MSCVRLNMLLVITLRRTLSFATGEKTETQEISKVTFVKLFTSSVRYLRSKNLFVEVTLNLSSVECQESVFIVEGP